MIIIIFIGLLYIIWYKLTIRFQTFALYYPLFLIFFSVASITEITISTSMYTNVGNGFLVQNAIVAVLSSITHCKLQLLITLFLSLFYLSFRVYYWIDKTSDLINFIGFQAITFIFIYFYSRWQSQGERKLFQQKNNTKQMLKIFLGLIKSHHDGITITESNEIVFHNQQMLKIFGINEFQEIISN